MKTLKAHKKLAIFMTLIVVALAFVLIKVVHHTKTPTTPQPSSAQNINYGPPTDTEKQETAAHKDDLANQNQASPSTDTTKTVTPIIVNAYQTGGQVSVSGYVPGIVEDGGTCTFTISRNSQKVTATSTGVANVSSTSCPIANFQRSQFSEAGDWQVVLSYKSDKGSGSSAPHTLTIQ